MKIGIMADSHLGVKRFQQYHNFQNKVEYINNNAVQEQIDIMKREGVDKIINAGDLFDSYSPSVPAILKANEILGNINIDTTIIGGNHDYSQRFNQAGEHVFDLLNNTSKDVKLYHKDTQIEVYDKVMIAYVPYKALGKNAGKTFKTLNQAVEDNQEKYKILVFHGQIDYDNEMHSLEYDMPTEITDLFDFVTMGHVHVSSTINQIKNVVENGELVEKDVFHLTPGGAIPSRRANQGSTKPAVYILDTDTNKLTSYPLTKSYEVFNYRTDNINEVLESIANGPKDNLHIIEYNDAMTLMDDNLYLKAVQNSIKVILRNTVDVSGVEVKKVEEFWDFVQKEHPDLLKEFKEVKDEAF